MSKLQSLLEDLEKAVGNLAEVLAMSKNKIVRDSAIKRFELCYDLVWKTLKAYLEEYHDVRCASPYACFREAYNQGIIQEYDTFWFNLNKLRNETVHTYKEPLAEDAYAKLPKALEHFQQLYNKLNQG